jgi:hypothetical protein
MQNIKNDFERVFLFISAEDYYDYFQSLELNTRKISFSFVESRPTFNTFFEKMYLPLYSNQINVMANSDIFFTEGLSDIRDYMSNLDTHTCVALSRYDYDRTNGLTPFHRADSQDTWIFNDRPQIRTELEFGMGMAGCDNRLAYDIINQGYQIINPCSSIVTYHLHSSNVRNYLNDKSEPINRIPPPYHLVTPQ